MSMLARKEEPWLDGLLPPEVTGVLSALQDAQWLAGEEVSLADIASFVRRLVRVDLFGLVAARPRMNDWYARMTSRPAYASAMPPAGSEGGKPAPG